MFPYLLNPCHLFVPSYFQYERYMCTYHVCFCHVKCAKLVPTLEFTDTVMGLHVGMILTLMCMHWERKVYAHGNLLNQECTFCIIIILESTFNSCSIEKHTTCTYLPEKNKKEESVHYLNSLQYSELNKIFVFESSLVKLFNFYLRNRQNHLFYCIIISIIISKT